MKKPMIAELFSRDDGVILEEVMNIAFGQASSDLARVIDIRILLTPPQVEILRADELLQRIGQETQGHETLNLIEQNFWGKYTGSALLTFPSSASKGLISLFDDEEHHEGNILLEKESLLEVANILIGTCVSKLAELLEDQVSFSPPRFIPRVVVNQLASAAIAPKLQGEGKPVILMKTVFHLQDRDVKGYLFLVASQASMEWLKTALNSFVEKF